MDISATNLSQPTTTSTTSKKSDGILSSDFETFLKMLTTQARYQDPLEPIDSSEYAAQLAQFSMVEQQVMSNDLLEALGAQMGAGNMAQLAGWIGMEARTTEPVSFSGNPIRVIPSPMAGADKAYLVVQNDAGAEVQRVQIPVTTEPLEWAGVQFNGTPFAPGIYSFAVDSHTLGKSVGITPAETYSRITEARKQGADTILILDGGIPVSATDVTALREQG